jgi:hypothetical protein
MTVPYTFATAVGLVPASELDVNFAYVSNNVSTANTVVANSQPNITTVGILANLSVTGNVIAARLKGEGGNISNIQGANISGAVANATYSTNSIQANIANIANLVTGSNVSGSVAQANIANIANLVVGSNVSGQVANALIAGTVYTNAQPNITSVGTLTSLSTSGNITGANLITGGQVSATGTVTGGNLSGTNIEGVLTTASQTNITSVGTLDSLSATGNIRTGGIVSATGNVLGGNVKTVGLISATGNVNGNYFIGNGSQLTGITSSYDDANVTTLLSNLGSNAISSTGNITTTANISGNYFIGNGSQLTGLGATYGNANVVANLAALGSNPVSTTGNITGGNILTGGLISATGNITGNYFIGNGSQLTGISNGVQSSIANGISNVEIASANGNVTITANAETYTFGTDSTLTLPGGSRLRPLGANLDIFAGTGSYVQLINSNESSSIGVSGAGCYITTAGGTWDFDNAGNLTAPGNFSAVGTVTGNNISAVTAFQLPVYANTTARDTAISSPAVGMLIVVGNTYQGYNGASWGNITLT